jgi:hypothetical protein
MVGWSILAPISPFIWDFGAIPSIVLVKNAVNISIINRVEIGIFIIYAQNLKQFSITIEVLSFG